MSLDDWGQTPRFPPNDPREWLNRARSNLAQAREGSQIPEVYLEDLCFAAQPATEKALKAVLIQLGIRFPRVHDLAELIGLLEETGMEIPNGVRQAARLTRYAVATRYPGIFEPVTPEQYQAALFTAEEVVYWAQQVIRAAE